MPRRRVNQCEMSAISGAKLAELPTPISRLAMANQNRLGASPDAMKAETEGQRRPDHRHDDAEAVDQPADEHGAAAEAQHRQRVGQRRIGAGHIEFRLHGGQRHHHRPHADAADAADQQRRRQAHPGVGGLHLSVASIADCLCRSVHGRATICGNCPRVKRGCLYNAQQACACAGSQGMGAGRPPWMGAIAKRIAPFLPDRASAQYG